MLEIQEPVCNAELSQRNSLERSVQEDLLQIVFDPGRKRAQRRRKTSLFYGLRGLEESVRKGTPN